jgi:predicted transcriptional regulator
MSNLQVQFTRIIYKHNLKAQFTITVYKHSVQEQLTRTIFKDNLQEQLTRITCKHNLQLGKIYKYYSFLPPISDQLCTEQKFAFVLATSQTWRFPALLHCCQAVGGSML